MQKRKLKLNVLDVTIVILIICAIAALAFRETIGDLFSKPEIAVIEVTVIADRADGATDGVLSVGNTVTISSKTQLQAVVSGTDVTETEIKAVLTCNGYEKHGRFYTENGDLLDIGVRYSVRFGEATAICSLTAVEIAD